jgi:integrase
MPKLTKTLVEAIEPEEKDVLIWDSAIPGFAIRVRPTGRRVYILKYRNKQGRQRKPTIGVHGAITVDQARVKARKWLGIVSDGGDPSADQQTERKMPNIRDLAEKFLKDHAETHKRPSSVANDHRLIEKKINPAIGSLAVNSINRSDVAKLHNSLRKTPYEANRVLALLSKMFNLAELWGLRPDGSNPCRHIQRFPEKKRERFLSSEELARLGEALTEADNTQMASCSVIACLRLLIFTGCRLSEILTLRWDQVDFQGQCLNVTETKTGPKVVHLGPPALEVLSCHEQIEDNPFVIVGHKPGSHLVNMQKPWRRIRKFADLDDVRIHDLRHTFASAGASAGLSLPIIGKMLGHTQAQTTQRYAHLASDPIKQATDQVSEKIAAAMRGDGGEVISIKPRRPN